MELLAATDTVDWLRPVIWFLAAAGIAVAVGFLLRYMKARSQKRYEEMIQRDREEGEEGSESE